MGWIQRLAISLVYVALQCTLCSGRANTPWSNTQMAKMFMGSFLDSMRMSPAFSPEQIDEVSTTGETLMSSIDRMARSGKSSARKLQALTRAFATSMGEIAVDGTGGACIEDKTDAIANALSNAFLQTTGFVNSAFVNEIRNLVSIFAQENLNKFGRADPGAGAGAGYGARVDPVVIEAAGAAASGYDGGYKSSRSINSASTSVGSQQYGAYGGQGAGVGVSAGAGAGDEARASTAVQGGTGDYGVGTGAVAAAAAGAGGSGRGGYGERSGAGDGAGAGAAGSGGRGGLGGYGRGAGSGAGAGAGARADGAGGYGPGGAGAYGSAFGASSSMSNSLSRKQYGYGRQGVRAGAGAAIGARSGGPGYLGGYGRGVGVGTGAAAAAGAGGAGGRGVLGGNGRVAGAGAGAGTGARGAGRRGGLDDYGARAGGYGRRFGVGAEARVSVEVPNANTFSRLSTPDSSARVSSAVSTLLSSGRPHEALPNVIRDISANVRAANPGISGCEAMVQVLMEVLSAIVHILSSANIGPVNPGVDYSGVVAKSFQVLAG